jgi:acetoin utilization deacetylase AcuC-like enzyme
MTEILYLHHPSSLRHDTGAHPERAERIVAIERELASRDWLGCRREAAPHIDRERLESVHPAAYINSIARFSRAGGGMLDADTVVSEGSWEAAMHAAGGAARAVDALMTGEAATAFCGLRPPGHHAESSQAMGFCLFNNAAIACMQALETHGAERVLVLDWDVHHGNGTNDIFHASDRVLYASIHQSPLYPGTGPLDDNGSGAGEGFTVNLPVQPGTGHAEWLSLVQRVVVPIGRAHRPGLVIVSAGYDAHRDDPLASCLLSDETYGAMAASMRDLAAELDAPLLFLLEGGYDLGALSRSVVATIEAAGGNGPVEQAGDTEPASMAAAHYSRWWPLDSGAS